MGTATSEKQNVTHSMLKQTNARLDQFESLMMAICQKLGVKENQNYLSPESSPRKGKGKIMDDDDDLAMVPAGSPGKGESVSPQSQFRRATKAENLNDRVRANLVRVYGRNRQLLMVSPPLFLDAYYSWHTQQWLYRLLLREMAVVNVAELVPLQEAETIVLWAALHWSHYHLSFTFCRWRGTTHGGMLREILATRAALHWRMQEVRLVMPRDSWKHPRLGQVCYRRMQCEFHTSWATGGQGVQHVELHSYYNDDPKRGPHHRVALLRCRIGPQ